MNTTWAIIAIVLMIGEVLDCIENIVRTAKYQSFYKHPQASILGIVIRLGIYLVVAIVGITLLV